MRQVEDEVNAVVRQNARRLHAADGDRRGDRGGRHGAVRREIRRRSARALHGPATPARGDGLFGRTVRRHACAADSAISGCSRSCAESAVAAGVRRIEALTGEAARAYLEVAGERVPREAAQALRTAPAELPARVAATRRGAQAARARTGGSEEGAGACRRRGGLRGARAVDAVKTCGGSRSFARR